MQGIRHPIAILYAIVLFPTIILVTLVVVALEIVGLALIAPSVWWRKKFVKYPDEE